jgi:hypothetical protein
LCGHGENSTLKYELSNNPYIRYFVSNWNIFYTKNLKYTKKVLDILLITWYNNKVAKEMRV